MIGTVKHAIRLKQNKLIDKWLKHRLTHLNQHQLQHKNIFVFPSKFGLVYLGFCVLLFGIGINYQNNMILLSSYLLIAIFLTSIFQSYFNLLNLNIKLTQISDGYAKRQINAKFRFTTDSPVFDCLIKINTQQKVIEKIEKQATCQFSIPVSQRGLYSLSRIKLSSHYPFGLLRTWSYLYFSEQYHVYPTPKPTSWHKADTIVATGAETQQISGHHGDEFFGIREYRSGESLNKVSWKHVAKHDNWVAKDFSSPLAPKLWFEFNALSGDTEQRLSQLSFLVDQAYADGNEYGLILPTQTIGLDSGHLHHRKCQRVLSLFGFRHGK